jgi:hypothetical protein
MSIFVHKRAQNGKCLFGDGILHSGFKTELLSQDRNIKTQEFFDLLENLFKEGACHGWS